MNSDYALAYISTPCQVSNGLDHGETRKLQILSRNIKATHTYEVRTSRQGFSNQRFK